MTPVTQIALYRTDDDGYIVKIGHNEVVTISDEQAVALDALQEAVEEHPDSGELYDFLGWEC
ncbi:MAG: hypothetical protein ACE5OQ_11530 [Woeseia sp.]